jgi:cobalt-zinc-cadmium efflux system membrane fusion protein
MKSRQHLLTGLSAAALSACLLLVSCGSKDPADPSAGAPPPTQVERAPDSSLVKVDHPDQFPVVAAEPYDDTPTLDVTGVVSPDISRNVPVISVAAGRIVEVHARLGDEVKKGQLLMKVMSSDISGAFSDYQRALADEKLARAQLERAKILLEKGALAAKDEEVAQDAEEKAKVDVKTAEEHLHVLGADINNPTTIVPVYAPISGVITDQQVTAAAGTQGLGAPNAFTISDLSHIWIMCDVYENDLPFVKVGEFADIKLAAFPGHTFRGRIGNIGPILDPNIRTAKVRIELQNPGMMRMGMFVTATFHSSQRTMRAAVPASAVLHLHDRDWVYTPVEGSEGQFRRVEVVGGKMVPPDLQEILSGVRAGDRVVKDALVLQNTAEQ